MDDSPRLSALLLLRFRREAQDAGAAFADAVRGGRRAAGIRPALSAGAGFLAGTAHGEALRGQPIFDALLLLPAFEHRHVEDLRTLLDRIDSAIDRAASAAIVGRPRLTMPGSGPLTLVMPWRRQAALSRADAQAYWHDRHGAVVRARGARTGYRQIHTVAEASAGLADPLGFGIADHDGAVVNGASDLDTLRAIFGHAHVRDVALADERRFIDHRRSTLQAFRPVDED